MPTRRGTSVLQTETDRQRSLPGELCECLNCPIEIPYWLLKANTLTKIVYSYRIISNIGHYVDCLKNKYRRSFKMTNCKSWFKWTKNRFDLLAGISFKLSKTLYIPQEIVSSDVILRLKRSLEFTVSHCLIFIIEKKNPHQNNCTLNNNVFILLLIKWYWLQMSRFFSMY